MGIILGLMAAVGWGSADFVARYSSRAIGFYRTLLYMQVIGLVVLSLYLALSGEFVRLYNETSWLPWAWGMLATLFGIGGSLALYRSFEVGIISLVSPICASYAALTTVLAIASGERLDLLRSIGIVAAIVGVILASTTLTPKLEAEIGQAVKRSHGLPPGVGLAMLAAVCFGVSFWATGFFVAPALGGIAPVWLSRLTTILLLTLVARPFSQSISVPQRQIWWPILGIGVLDTVGYVAATIGLTLGEVAVVSVLGSLFSAVTVLLAAIFLREKLVWNQWLGIAIIGLGVALVSIKSLGGSIMSFLLKLIVFIAFALTAALGALKLMQALAYREDDDDELA